MANQTNVLLIVKNTFHGFDEMSPRIDVALGDEIAVTRTTDRDALLDLTDSSLSRDQRDALTSFVSDGGGYLGIHCAADIASTHMDPAVSIPGRTVPRISGTA